MNGLIACGVIGVVSAIVAVAGAKIALFGKDEPGHVRDTAAKISFVYTIILLGCCAYAMTYGQL